MRSELAPYSPLMATPVYQLPGQGELVPGLMQCATLPDPTDQVVVVTAAMSTRLDNVSTAFYGTPHLWWVLSLVNDNVDPLLGFEIGTRIRVPTRERLAREGLLTA